MSDATPLDPDQVLCPKCEANPGEVCTTPTGRKSRTIHVERRRAAAGDVPPRIPAVATDTPKPKRRTPKGKPFDSDKAAAAGRKSAQERRRRRSEQEAAIEAAKEAKLREEAEANAVRLAEDAVRFERDRAILRRQTLDAARKAYTRLIEGLDGLQRIQLDDDGRPVYVAVERQDKEGRPRVVNVPDVRGAYSADTIERLAKVAASTLNSLRLEEGSPTGINRTETTPSTAEQLGDAGVEELVRWASENLPGGSS